MRVVLYAEGPADRGTAGLQAPGRPLAQASEGPAHVLVRRMMAEDFKLEPRFDVPLRHRAREACGSDFKRAATLKKLLSWLRPDLRPDLAIVMIDRDGDRQIRTQLQRATGHVSVPRVIAMAVEEFEAWLIADAGATAEILGAPVQGGQPERLAPREAKQLLGAHLSRRIDRSTSKPLTERSLRLALAEACDLDVLTKRCRSFKTFRGDLKAAVSSQKPGATP